jgi:hypothetical protein
MKTKIIKNSKVIYTDVGSLLSGSFQETLMQVQVSGMDPIKMTNPDKK